MSRFSQWRQFQRWWGRGMYDLAVVTWRLGHPWAALTCIMESFIYHFYLTPLGLQRIVEFIRRMTVPEQVWIEAKMAIENLAKRHH